jgi:tetratricopeptide (TPR) repeat protein
MRPLIVVLGLATAWGDENLLRESERTQSLAQLRPNAYAAADAGLARAIRIQQAVDAVLRTRDFALATEIFDQELRGRKHGDVSEWLLAAVAHSHTGSFDDAFAYLDEAVERGLELDPKGVEEELIRTGVSRQLTSDTRYSQFMERLCELRDSWQSDLEPARYGVDEPNSTAMDALRQLGNTLPAHEFAQKLAEFNEFPNPSKRDFWLKFDYFGVARKHSFFLYVPPGYDPARPTPMIVYLHGENTKHRRMHRSESRTFLMDNPFHEIARQENLLLMCPVADNDVNWWEQNNINALSNELVMVKKRFNVDDNAVWLSGHSKGGTSAFGIAINAPSAFASFYPMNATPIPTRLGNLQHRPIYSTYSSKDPKFPIENMEALWRVACEQNANWLFRELHGHDHSYHSYIDQELPHMVQHMFQSKRPPLPSRITWETSMDVISGCDWLRVERVTPGQNRAEWHDRSSSSADALPSSLDATKPGLRRNEDTGKIRAVVNGNTFHVETSQIGEFSIRLNPQMVDFRYPIKVYVNGRLLHDEQVMMDSDVMMNYFDREADRQRIWGNVLRVLVPKRA